MRLFKLLIVFTLATGLCAWTGDSATDLPAIDSLWDYNNPAKTEAAFRELLPKAEKSGNRDYYVQLLSQLARTLSMQNKITDSHQVLDKAEALLGKNMPTATVRYLLERGRTYNTSEEKEKARACFMKAFRLSEEKQLDAYSLDAAHMMGIVEPVDQQMAWHLKALAIAEQTQDKRLKGWLGPLYNNIGWTYFDNKQYEKALTYFKKDLAWRQEIGDAAGGRISKWSVARTYRALNKLDKAMKLQREIEGECKQQKITDNGYNLEELGELLLLQGKKQQAYAYFAKAHAILAKDAWLAEHEPERLKRLQELGAKAGGKATE